MKIIVPDDAHPLDVAQALVGERMLLKAEHVPQKYGMRTFRRHPAMRASVQRFEGAYAALLDKLMDTIIDYVEREVLLDTIEKSERRAYEPLLTPADYHLAFIASQIGPEMVSSEDVQRLIDSGVLPPDLAFAYRPRPGELPPRAARAISDAYKYGLTLGQKPLVSYGTQGMGEREFSQIEAPELTPQEQASLAWAEHHAANTIVGLGNTVADDFSTIAIEADGVQRGKYQKDIREAVAQNILRKETWRKLASDLGHKTGDWSRGFKRIAATEKQAAVNQGIIAGLVEREGDPKNTKVAKLPAPDACDDCVRLHLTAGQGSKPKIFSLSDLIDNGSNVGRKASSWRAIVGPTHPYCGCQLVHVPHGWSFNDEGELKPENLARSELLEGDLRKAMTYGAVVPEHGCAVRVGDPAKRVAIEAVLAATPAEIFDKRIGVTLVTEDHPRSEVPMDDHDLAYWTGNEVRLSTQLPLDRVDEVLKHELGHSLNVYLMHKWGGVEPVRKWHSKLYRVSKGEGFVSKYASSQPIENAAEVTKMYLYSRLALMRDKPRTFALLDAAYRDIWRARERGPERIGEAAKQARDKRDLAARGGAKL